MRLGTLVVISFTVAPIATIASQEPPALNAGARIRATSTSVSGGPLLGTVLAFDADSLIVQGDTGTWRLSLASLTHLDKSEGQRSHALKGAGTGLLVGAGVGALIGSGCDTVEGPFASKVECIAVGAAAFGAGGALVGAAIGALTRTERWTEVPLDRLRISFMPRRGSRVQFMASLNF
jgi:hypothetical protein